MTAPTTAGGAVLPAEVVKRLESSLDWMLKGMHTGPLVSALDYRLIIGWLGQIDALRAELRAMTDDRSSWCAQASARTEDAVRFAAERDALKAAQDDQARDAGRLALLETALSEVLEFQSAPEGPHIFDWGRWRRIRDNTPPFQRAATKETP